MLTTLEEQKLLDRIVVITTDLFSELVPFLESGRILATLYQRPFTQGKSAFEALIRYVVDGVAPPLVTRLTPHIVLRSNLPLFLDRIAESDEAQRHKGTGQGAVTAPPSAPFPWPYREDFESTALHRSPKFLADQDGAFEVLPCDGRSGKCLGQVITDRPIPWGPLPDPWTLAGDAAWTDHQVAADVRMDSSGSAMVIGRIDSADVFRHGEARLPSGYTLRLHSNGIWELLSSTYREITRTLAQGQVAAAGHWHHLELRFTGPQITASLGGKPLAQVQDASHTHGMFGIGSEWNRAQLDNVAVTPGAPVACCSHGHHSPAGIC